MPLALMALNQVKDDDERWNSENNDRQKQHDGLGLHVNQGIHLVFDPVQQHGVSRFGVM